MIIGYIRVSTIDQNDDRQLVTMKKYGVNKIFREKVSAKNTIDRIEFNKMMDFINNFYEFNKELDDGSKQQLILVVHDFSRLARSTKDLLNIVDTLESKEVTLISAKENIDSSTPTGKLMLTMIGAINEFERTNLLERQREGIAIAKAKGVYKGRKAIDKPDNWNDVYSQWKNRLITGVEAMKLTGLKRSTFYKFINEESEKDI